MFLFEDATINCSKDTAKIYEWALGHFAQRDVLDADGNKIGTEDDPSKPIDPIRFPLSGVHIVQHGNRATISIPRPGRAAFELDRLVRCAEPKKTVQDGEEVFTIGGESERLFRQGVNPADAQVDFVITQWAGRLAPASQP